MDKKNEKKFIQSPIAIICYVLAALMVVYACYQGGSTVRQINEYYAGYGMTAKASEYIMYVMQAALEPLIHAFTFFMAGFILNTVRKLDSKNYKTAAEIAEMAEAKIEAEDKKQAAKGEARAIKAAKKGKGSVADSKEESVRADFTESLEAELKADAKTNKSAGRKSSGTGSSRGKGSESDSDGGRKTPSKSGESKSGSKSGSKSAASKSGSKSGSRSSASKSGSAKSGSKSSASKSTDSKRGSRGSDESKKNDTSDEAKFEAKVDNDIKNIKEDVKAAADAVETPSN